MNSDTGKEIWMGRAMRKDLPELPCDRIVIHEGRVCRFEDWTLWNLVPWMTILVERESDEEVVTEHGEFLSSIGDPEHGGGSKRGTLDEVIVGLHPTFQEQYRALFGLEDADEAGIRGLGLEIIDRETVIEVV